MPTDRQCQANRRNAQKSTGPRTPEGKARSSANALRHGLTARGAVLPEEDHALFAELLAGLQTQFAPVGALEELLLLHFANASWRMLRHARLEAGVLRARARVARRQEYDTSDPDAYGPQLDRTEAEQEFDDDTLILGQSFFGVSDGDAAGKLNRYENTVRRSMYMALNALREAQARRLNPPPQPPAQNEPNPAQPTEPSTTCGTAPASPQPPPASPRLGAGGSLPGPALGKFAGRVFHIPTAPATFRCSESRNQH